MEKDEFVLHGSVRLRRLIMWHVFCVASSANEFMHCFIVCSFRFCNLAFRYGDLEAVEDFVAIGKVAEMRALRKSRSCLGMWRSLVELL